MATEPHGYPVPGTLADELFRATEADFRRRFGNPLQPGAAPVPDGAVHLMPERLIGMMWWNHGEPGWLVGALFPPFSTTPWLLCLTAPFAVVSEGLSLLGVLERFGLPQPEMNPTWVMGQATRQRARVTMYAPGPAPLVELSYAISIVGNDCRATATAYMPPEPERSRTLEANREAFPWVEEGTMFFESLEEVRQRRSGRLYRPGAWQMRTLL